MSKSWYRVRAAADAPKDGVQNEGFIDIYDEIGMWGITASDFIRDLRALGDDAPVTLNVNSPGGEVFAGLAIHNALKRHKGKVMCRVDGIAASIASVIAMAADEVVMPENAMMMIHNPAAFAMGTAEDMRETADFLDKVTTSLISAYRQKTGLEDDEIAEMMAATTWLTAAEAMEKGFCDRMDKPVKMAACANLSRYPNVPAALVATAEAGGISPAALIKENDVSDTPKAGATPAVVAEAPVAAAVPAVDALPSAADPAAAPVDAAPAAPAIDEAAIEARGEAKALAYVAEVQDLCALAGQSAKANAFIKAKTPLAQIRAELLNAQAAASEAAPIASTHTNTTTAQADAKARAENYGWDKALAAVTAPVFNPAKR